MNIDLLWNYLYERESIRLRREAGVPRPWTNDAILNVYKFTNVYREDDRVTKWMATNVRKPLELDMSLIHACIAFRWFNRITTGEAIFQSKDSSVSPWMRYYYNIDSSALKTAILEKCGKGPYITGAYIIKTPSGMNKLDGVLNVIDTAAPFANDICYLKDKTLQKAYDILVKAPYMGSFTAAQVMADLKYTPEFLDAPDWYTFVQSGPGSRAGLNIIMGRPVQAPWKEAEWVKLIQEVREKLTPKFAEHGWVIPHAQDVQSGLCELSKYIRGYSRNTFVPSKEAL